MLESQEVVLMRPKTKTSEKYDVRDLKVEFSGKFRENAFLRLHLGDSNICQTLGSRH